MSKSYNQSNNPKYQEFNDDFEDFGYKVKNIRRQSKKKVAKFKDRSDYFEDSF
jgi:ribosome recycling factor